MNVKEMRRRSTRPGWSVDTKVQKIDNVESSCFDCLSSASNARKRFLYMHQIQIPKLLQILQLLIHKQTRHSLARPNAHARQQYFLLLSSAFTESSTDLSCACSSKRVT